MLYSELKERTNEIKKGTMHSLTISKAVPTYKKVTDIVEKVTKINALQVNVDYSNLKRIKEKYGINPETGRANVQARQWGEWNGEEDKNLFLTYKGQLYFVAIPTKNTKYKSTYYLNGVEVEKEQVEHLILKKKKSDEPSYLNIKIENVKELK